MVLFMVFYMAKPFFFNLQVMCIRLFYFICLIFGALCANAQHAMNVIPEPVSIKLQKGNKSFVFDKNICFKYDLADTLQEASVTLFQKQLKDIIGLVPSINENLPSKEITLQINDVLSLPKEGYVLSVMENSILIEAANSAGLLYGLQTLLQLIPLDGSLEIPLLKITDYPRLSWRGFMLDVSRHFFDKKYILKLLDVLAMHKINVFHWHLTDNHGWRVEIKKYPLLTQIAAWRADRTGLPWRQREPLQKGEVATYGGYYTQADVKEVVEYAAKLNIMVIPEIEMPGHCVEVFAAYPEYSCENKKLDVPVGGVAIGNSVFCAGKESTFHFLEDVLDEILSLFPSEYVHIGGDEVSKTKWKSCKFCQQRINDEKLADEEQLQTYFMNRMVRYIERKGKRVIGWDDILQEGLSTNTIVMSWRGFEGGVEALKLGHPAIMTPSLFTYLNFYQASPDFEPANRSAFVTSLKTAYSFNPIPKGLTSKEQKNILGAQACVWTEFIPNEEHLEYMMFPRLGATADAMWALEKNRDWDAFLQKQPAQKERYRRLGLNYSEGSYQVGNALSYRKNTVTATLSSEQINPEMRYTTDGTVPNINSPIYSKPLTFYLPTHLKAGILKNGKLMESPLDIHLIPGNKAYDKKVKYLTPCMKKYPGGGAKALVDGKYADKFRVNERWQGFDGEGIDVVIDLKRKTSVRTLHVNFLHMPERKIYLPVDISVYTSLDGVNFKEISKISGLDYSDKRLEYKTCSLDLCSEKTRFIRLKAVNKDVGNILFVDEIVIE